MEKSPKTPCLLSSRGGRGERRDSGGRGWVEYTLCRRWRGRSVSRSEEPMGDGAELREGARGSRRSDSRWDRRDWHLAVKRRRQFIGAAPWHLQLVPGKGEARSSRKSTGKSDIPSSILPSSASFPHFFTSIQIRVNGAFHQKAEGERVADKRRARKFG